MAMNLPTPATQAPSRVPAGTRGSLATSSERSASREPAASAAPETSGITPDRSAMPPSASTRPGRSAPAAPKRTSFKCVSRELCGYRSGGRQAGRADGFELLVGEDEFLVAERLGLRELAACDLLHELEDLAPDLVELRALQDAPGVHVHVIRHACV